MLKYVFIAIALLTLCAAAPSVHAFGGQGLKNYCAWYSQKARAAGRKGKTKQSEAYWQMYRDCMRGRI